MRNGIAAATSAERNRERALIGNILFADLEGGG